MRTSSHLKNGLTARTTGRIQEEQNAIQNYHDKGENPNKLKKLY